MQKPPLGVMPYKLWSEANPAPTDEQMRERQLDVDAAIGRYVEAGRAPAVIWVMESNGWKLRWMDMEAMYLNRLLADEPIIVE